MLEIKNVTKKFEDQVILQNCNMFIDTASIVGLVGVNGSGKSTLLRCITGIYKCDEGKIIFDGEEIYENENIKKDIMFLSDDPYISQTMTIKDLKDFYLNFYPTFCEKEYKNYLRQFKLDETVPLRKFSKGMRRQAYILVILSFKPKLLILDESFDGLDPIIKKEVKKAIGNLVSENQSIVIISSHSLHDIESICDRIVIVSDKTISSAEDLDENKEQYHYFQLAFDRSVLVEEFSPLELIDTKINSKFAKLLIKGNKADILKKLKSLNPLMIEELDLSLEDLFIARMKGGKQDV